MLANYPAIAFIATHNPNLAKQFYSGTLGLHLVREDEQALVYEAEGLRLHITIVQDLVAVKYSVLGWEVPDIVAVVTALRKAGVEFVKLEVSKQQDELGIWTNPRGEKVAWFHDPDNNVLCIKQAHV